MCLIPQYTTDTDTISDPEPIEYEVEALTQPFMDTIPCPPLDWEELELE